MHCVFWREHTPVQGCSSPLKDKTERQKKERKKLILCLTHLPFSNLNGYNKPLAIWHSTAGNIWHLSLVVWKNPCIFCCFSLWSTQLSFQWKLLWELEEFAFTYGLNCSTSPSAVARPTQTPCPSPPTTGVESHKKFCGERSAPHYAAQGEYSSSTAHNVRTFYLRLPHFHLHGHHQKRHRKTCGLYLLWNRRYND